MSQNPAEEVSAEEENVLDFSTATPNQEHEKHIREIFFSEEGDQETVEAPLSSCIANQELEQNTLPQENLAAVTFVQTTADFGTAAEFEKNAPSAESAETVPVEEASEAETEEMDDFNCCWTQTVKKYAHVGFGGKDSETDSADVEVLPAQSAEKVPAEEAEETKETEEILTVSAVEAVETEKEADAETDAETGEAEDVSEGEAEENCELENASILSEDGSLSRVLNRYERPSGFGFGLLEEELEAAEEEETAEAEEEFECAQEEEPEPEMEEVCEDVSADAPQGLDSWGSLAFELGLPVTFPTEADSAVKAAPQAEKVEKKGRISKSEKVEKTEKADETAKTEKSEKLEKAAKGAKAERAERAEKCKDVKEMERAERAEKAGKPERTKKSSGKDCACAARAFEEDEPANVGDSKAVVLGKITVDLDDEDFVAPESIHEMYQRSEPTRRERGRKGQEAAPQTIQDVSEMDARDEFEAEETALSSKGRRRRSSKSGANDAKSAAIGGILAGVVASKMNEDEKGAKKQTRAARVEEEKEISSPRKERSRRSRKSQAEESAFENSLPEDEEFMVQEQIQEQAAELDFEDDEFGIPNGARSRRRRRNQREKLERTRTKAAQTAFEEEEEDEEEDSVPVKKRSRRGVKGRQQERFADSRQDDEELSWKVSMEEVAEEEEAEEDEMDETPIRSRRSRRSRRSETAGRDGGRRSAASSYDEDEDEYENSHVCEDDEEHVFTEVGNDYEDEDDEWETDFSQHDVPSWRYTIDFIVNTNLKARKREPSSMAGNLGRMSKRFGKRK